MVDCHALGLVVEREDDAERQVVVGRSEVLQIVIPYIFGIWMIRQLEDDDFAAFDGIAVAAAVVSAMLGLADGRDEVRFELLLCGCS